MVVDKKQDKTKQLGRNRGIPKTQRVLASTKNNSEELEASLAPAEAEVGALAKADHSPGLAKCFILVEAKTLWVLGMPLFLPSCFVLFCLQA